MSLLLDEYNQFNNDRNVILISSDDVEFEVSQTVASMSNLVKSMLPTPLVLTFFKKGFLLSFIKTGSLK